MEGGTEVGHVDIKTNTWTPRHTRYCSPGQDTHILASKIKYLIENPSNIIGIRLQKVLMVIYSN